MDKYVLQYATERTVLQEFEASKLSYSGGDGVVVVVFRDNSDNVLGLAALQPGMVVKRKG